MSNSNLDLVNVLERIREKDYSNLPAKMIEQIVLIEKDDSINSSPTEKMKKIEEVIDMYKELIEG